MNTDIEERKGIGPRWGLVGAVVSAVGASICCVGPLLLPYIIPYAFAGENGRSTAMRQVTLSVQNITCDACAVTVKKSLTRLDGVKDAKVTANPPLAVVTYDPARIPVERLVEATTRAGFPSRIVPEGGKLGNRNRCGHDKQ